MARTTYDTPASADAARLIEEIFALGRVGYVALESAGQVLMRTAPELVSDTTPETNFYEELLVNPTLVKLVSQRAQLDCGGLRYIAIGYGHFMQFVMPTRTGHISIGVPRGTQPAEFADRVQNILRQNGQDAKKVESTLLA